MKTWLLSLGTLFMCLPLFGQSLSIPSNLGLTLIPTDSLGLYLPGYNVIPEVHFQVSDTGSIAFIELGVVNADTTSNLSYSIPWDDHLSFTDQGLTIRRQGLDIWVGIPPLPHSTTYAVRLRLTDTQGVSSAYSTDNVVLGQ